MRTLPIMSADPLLILFTAVNTGPALQVANALRLREDE
jgi:hypothetical protein